MEIVLGSIFWFLVATGLLVTFHEFGHFWVARSCGVKVLRFSIGLGKLPPGRYDCQVTVLDPKSQKAAFWHAAVMVVP